jgi:Sulfatase
VLGWALMKRFAILVGILWLVIAPFGTGIWGQGVPARNSSPDVFLITIDTLRADHVACYGYKQVETPALDALAAEGVRFTQAFTHSPITNTSHITILTGLLPSVHGVTDFGVLLLPQHDGRLGLAEAQIQQSDFAGALPDLEAFTKTDLRNAAALRLLARAHRGLGREQDAKRTEEQAEAVEQK